MTLDLALSMAAVFVSVTILAGTVTAGVLRRHAPERKRLRDLAKPPANAPGAILHRPLSLTDAPNAFAERICRMLPRSSKRMAQMRQRLTPAPYENTAEGRLEYEISRSFTAEATIGDKNSDVSILFIHDF